MENYLPLQGSKWAKENPGRLPYSKCTIELALSNETEGNMVWAKDIMEKWEKNAGFISNGPQPISEPLARPFYYLTCVARPLGLAYRIPVRFYTPDDHSFGLFINFPLIRNFDTRTQVLKLKGHSLNDVWGIYSGYAIGGGIFLISGSGNFTLNEAGIEIRTRSLNAGKVFEVGQATYSLNPRREAVLAECINPYILIGADTTQKRILEKDCVPNEAYAPRKSKTPVNIHEMNKLVFVKT